MLQKKPVKHDSHWAASFYVVPMFQTAVNYSDEFAGVSCWLYSCSFASCIANSVLSFWKIIVYTEV